MRTLSGSLLSILVATSVVHADVDQPPPAAAPASQPRSFVGVGYTTTETIAEADGAVLEGSTLLGDGVFHLRGQLAAGRSKLLGNNNGYFEELRAGVETHGFQRENRMRVFGGIDIGYRSDHARVSETMSTYVGSFIIVPRIGVENTHRLRFRTALEMPVTQQRNEDIDLGFGFTVSVGYAY